MDWPKEPCIRWGSKYPYVKGQFYGGRVAGPGHTRAWPAVGILKAIQQGAAPVRCGYRLGRTSWGTDWRRLVNTIESSVCGGDVATCQISLTTCVYVWRGDATGRALDLRSKSVAGSNPTGATLRNNLGQVVYTYMPLSQSSITWYRPDGGDAVQLGR